MSGRGKSKTKINISKPDLPPFLQRMKEQIVANEDAERKERSERKRKERPGKSDDLDGDPTIVKLDDDDLSEEEYKRMKKEMETLYKLDEPKAKPSELDMDSLIQTIQEDKSGGAKSAVKFPSSSRDTDHDSEKSSTIKIDKRRHIKKLSYESSDDD